ncbi:MAG: alpha/beta fold hydrolase [Clostridiaceae bacterium]|jgi:pimeloyl-ACP methyl ester carboxylesterase|nr:alpha/beta fold hydrolase [Clostridiaceae bacterium]
MSQGLTKRPGARIPVQKLVVRLAQVLSVIAVALIAFIMITAASANTLMKAEKTEIANIPSNILPPYSPTSFKSFDKQTNLSGWFFKAQDPKSTVILVHGTGSNRMPFRVETVDLVRDFLGQGFNVFLFDQRNSGESEGITTGYGYMEWKDVIGAIDHVRKISVTTNVILYGIGSGCSSALIAMNKLPQSDEPYQNVSESIKNLPFDGSYIAGLILDSPAKMSDDYIRPIAKTEFALGFITQFSIPYAIRISAGEGDNLNLASEIARTSVPVCILYGDRDVFVKTSLIDQIVSERERLHPSTTTIGKFTGAGYVEAYSIASERYREVITDFLTTHYQ